MEQKVKVGIEVHQQLDTNKLFCNCPSNILEDKPDFSIKRKLRLSQSEMGTLDKASLHEVKKNKEFHYYGYFKNTCLVELDEEPPHNVNPYALEIAIQISKAMKCKVVDNIVFMRKIVLDGSNTSGFQRTGLVSVDGDIEVEGKKIGIHSLCLEEDAAKVSKRTPDYDVYNLSRLGIPLLEITTAPDITSGKQAKKVAEYIGMLLRSSGKVKRGLGSIRQDINVSIPGGNRVEIKGAQDLRILDKIVDYEANRQASILKLMKTKINFDKIKPLDVTDIFKKTDCSIIKNKKKGVVFGINIPNFSEKIGFEIQPSKRLGTELSDYAKVKAGISGLFHSDELPKYGITDLEVKKVKDKLKCKDKDAFIIICEESLIANKAINSVIERLKDLSTGISEEVRKANQDGTSSYLRPISGSARMYPETDVPPVSTKKIKVDKLKLLSDLAVELEKKFKLSHDLANSILKSAKKDLILSLFKQFNILKPSYLAEIVLTSEKQIKKDFNKEILISDNNFIEAFKLLETNKISKNSILELLSLTDKKTIKQASSSFELADIKDIENEIKVIVEKNKCASMGTLMGLVMKKYNGKISGKDVSDIIRKLL
jgi:glutamyl-tRNA(Gln) amidotransferase subunit E